MGRTSQTLQSLADVGQGWESLTVKEFSLLKLMQKWSDPSFFLTSTTALHQELLLGHITPASSIILR